jgi:hypothetical protein
MPRQYSIRRALNRKSAPSDNTIIAPTLAITTVRSHLPAMLLLLKLTLWACRALALSRQALVLDNLALRHQLATLAHGGRRPRLVPADRLFWVALRRGVGRLGRGARNRQAGYRGRLAQTSRIAPTGGGSRASQDGLVPMPNCGISSVAW